MVLVFVCLIKDFHLVGLEIIASSKQGLCVATTVFVPYHLYVTVSQVSVRASARACIVGDVDIIAATECWSIAAVVIYGIFGYFDVKRKRFQAISVFKGKYEAVC